MMELETLKTKTSEIWAELHKLQHCYFDPWSDAVFLGEVRTYGDLAQPQTWRDAFASLKAQFLAAGTLEDGQYLIEFYLLYASQKWGWRELLPAVVAQLCLFPEAVEAIADGLATIRKYGCDYGATAQDLQEFEGILNGKNNQERWILGEQSANAA